MRQVEENEVPLHKRKKGKRLYTIEKRLTPEGAERRRQREEDQIQLQSQWSPWWSKYEKLKNVEQALENINMKKKNASHFHAYLKDYEYRIVEKGQK